MLDANWIDFGDIETNEQTDHDGQLNCRHAIDSPGGYDGFESTPRYDTIHFEWYRLSFKIKVISGYVTMRALVDSPFSGTLTLISRSYNSTDQGSWTSIQYDIYASIPYWQFDEDIIDGWIRFRNMSTQNPAEWYVDEVSWKRIICPFSSSSSSCSSSFSSCSSSLSSSSYSSSSCSSSSSSFSFSSSSSSWSVLGKTWGEQFPSIETPVEWTTWVWKETTTQARIENPPWGLLFLASGESAVSSVADFGFSGARHLRITWDDYASGSGTFTLYWRGQNTSFNKEDDEITGPTWEVYPTGGQNKSWRYAQIMAVG